MKKILAISAVLLACLSAISLNAKAQTSMPTPLINNYAQQREDANFHKYMDGAFDGLVVYNVFAQQKNQQKPAFCLPNGVDTSVKLAIEILDSYMLANPPQSEADRKLPTIFFLFLALESKYPCK